MFGDFCCEKPFGGQDTLEHNYLYEKKRNRYLIDYKITQLAKADMTYILGARCSDGVVLIGDTKITLEGGTKFTYGKNCLSHLLLLLWVQRE